LLDLLASDGAEPDTPGDDGSGSLEVNDADGTTQRGLNGKLDVGQVRAYYERKKKGEGKEKGVGVGLRGGPAFPDHSGKCVR
jgi:hypothetical protein